MAKAQISADQDLDEILAESFGQTQDMGQARDPQTLKPSASFQTHGKSNDNKSGRN